MYIVVRMSVTQITIYRVVQIVRFFRSFGYTQLRNNCLYHSRSFLSSLKNYYKTNLLTLLEICCLRQSLLAIQTHKCGATYKNISRIPESIMTGAIIFISVCSLVS